MTLPPILEMCRQTITCRCPTADQSDNCSCREGKLPFTGDEYVYMDKKNVETEDSLRLNQSKNKYQSNDWMDRQQEQLIMILCTYFKEKVIQNTLLYYRTKKGVGIL